ncbi:MAG: hypothetical protein ACYTEK_17005 [Planctomycetota bacterium]|jgi:hypothetical protein
MIDHILILRAITLSVTLVSIFTVLLATILKLIRQAAFFHGKMAVITAVALSLLFLVALFPFLAVPATGSGNTVDAPVGYFYVLPGVALTVAAAVVLSQVLLLAARIPPSEEPPAGVRETDAKKSKSSLAKPKARGRPKKEKPAEIKPKEATEPAGSSS